MKVAVVGGGISGLSAVWLLNEHSEHQVDLIEANHYVGGHTNTVEFRPSPLSPSVTNVDTGFIVFNELTYPNFLQFLELLKIDYINSDMSFSVKRAFGSPYEWSGNSIKSLFVGTTTWMDWFNQFRLIWDIIRFNWLAVDVLSSEVDREITVGEYLIENGYSEVFRRNYLLPMIASIWSTPANKTALLFPMQTLIRFMLNHHLLQILNQPQWLTIKNGSKTYVDRILSKLDPSHCYTNTPVDSISFADSGKQIYLKIGATQSTMGPYDQVIFACHADQAAEIIKRSDCSHLLTEELNLLSKFEFNKNQAVLHNDLRLMPEHKEVWTSWNYLITRPPNSSELMESQTRYPKHELGNRKLHQNVENTVSLTYWMNLLQSIPESIYGTILVTLNPPHPIESKYVFGTWNYDHPLYTSESVRAQRSLEKIQTKNRLSFIGAWTNYGFHEDGLTSALNLIVKDRSNNIFKLNNSPIQIKKVNQEIHQSLLRSIFKVYFFKVYNNLIILIEIMFINMIYNFNLYVRKREKNKII